MAVVKVVHDANVIRIRLSLTNVLNDGHHVGWLAGPVPVVVKRKLQPQLPCLVDVWFELRCDGGDFLGLRAFGIALHVVPDLRFDPVLFNQGFHRRLPIEKSKVIDAFGLVSFDLLFKFGDVIISPGVGTLL